MKQSKHATTHKSGSMKSMQTLKSENIEEELPLDELIITVKSLRLSDINVEDYMIKITFFDQLIIQRELKPFGKKDVIPDDTCMARGVMNYDPSDYEKMCLMADHPLQVQIIPMNVTQKVEIMSSTALCDPSYLSGSDWSIFDAFAIHINCCNIDILPIFIDQDKLYIKKHMEPLIKPPVRFLKSWCNLPFITLEISVNRNAENQAHHALLKTANYMKMTLVGAFNMIEPVCATDDTYVYTAGSKCPVKNETNNTTVIFSRGYAEPSLFNNMAFYPEWESSRTDRNCFSKSDEKLVFNYNNFTNIEIENMEKCLCSSSNQIIWGSFHRTLLLETANEWFKEVICKDVWPLEVQQISQTYIGYSFVAYLDLSLLLFPGEDTVLLAVPLYFVEPNTYREKCKEEPFLATTSKQMNAPLSSTEESSKVSLVTGQTGTTCVDTVTGKSTAFVIVQVRLGRPMKKVCIPQQISNEEMKNMLNKLEECAKTRTCTARGQLDRDWRSTIRMGLQALRKVPYYGVTEFCAFYRQLSETSTRVELFTSFWQDAAIFINNNFVVTNYVNNDELFQEMLITAHIFLMRSANDALVGKEKPFLDPILRAARHARQMKDISHAIDRYIEYVSMNKNNPEAWRELSTCFKDKDINLAEVCLRKALSINPRDPLSLLSLGCLVYEKNPEEAEIFFQRILYLYPFWAPAWVAINAYYIHRQLFYMADKVMELIKKTNSEGMLQVVGSPLIWECELGDWWDGTPLLSGISRYYEAADLLLRLRAISLAEICIARALSESGESTTYYHMVALCCRLRGKPKDALCHLKTGMKKFGEVNYLRSLESECYHFIGNIHAATETFRKAGTCISPYSNLLSISSYEQARRKTFILDLVRRQPNAYIWLTLAENWLKHENEKSSEYLNKSSVDETQALAINNAIACAVQALNYDRRAGRAWALLSRLVKPPVRQKFYKKMMTSCGYSPKSGQERIVRDDGLECFIIGSAVAKCKCEMCFNLSIN